MYILFISGIVLIMVKSVQQFISFTGDSEASKGKTSLSLELFFTMMTIYSIIILGFGIIYFILSFHQVALLDPIAQHHVGKIQYLFNCLYFSGVTLLTIGYGDISPIGIARLIALVQALIGYILPTTFVLKLVQIRKEKT